MYFVRVNYIATSAEMSVRELVHNRLILALAALVPLLSFAVAIASTQDRLVVIRLARAPTTDLLMVSQRSEALLFLGVAAVALMGAFFGANLTQRRVEVNRRLVLCGYHTWELMIAKLAVLGLIVVVSAVYTLGLLLMLLRIERPIAVFIGFGLAAFVYGAYGLLVGTIFRRDLEMIFAIVLLINLDAGWLQNPIYYLDTRSPWLVESLPGHLPAQVALLGALTSHPIAGTAAMGALYGMTFLAIALLVYGLRMRVAR